jgi:hypothetical protein
MLNQTLDNAVKFGFVSNKSTRINNVSKKEEKIDMTRLFSNRFRESKKLKLSNFKGVIIVIATLITYCLIFGK